jgi:hypothetical protein
MLEGKSQEFATEKFMHYVYSAVEIAMPLVATVNERRTKTGYKQVVWRQLHCSRGSLLGRSALCCSVVTCSVSELWVWFSVSIIPCYTSFCLRCVSSPSKFICVMCKFWSDHSKCKVD